MVLAFLYSFGSVGMCVGTSEPFLYSCIFLIFPVMFRCSDTGRCSPFSLCMLAVKDCWAHLVTVTFKQSVRNFQSVRELIGKVDELTDLKMIPELPKFTNQELHCCGRARAHVHIHTYSHSSHSNPFKSSPTQSIQSASAVRIQSEPHRSNQFIPSMPLPPKRSKPVHPVRSARSDLTECNPTGPLSPI